MATGALPIEDRVGLDPGALDAELRGQATLEDVLRSASSSSPPRPTAVAVWDHRPEARELLAARLERGWRPTPTALRGGERVLGYAACVLEHGRPG